MERLNANKGFTNKLWNAGKFIHQNVYASDVPPNGEPSELKVTNHIWYPVVQYLSCIWQHGCRIFIALQYKDEIRSENHLYLIFPESHQLYFPSLYFPLRRLPADIFEDGFKLDKEH